MDVGVDRPARQALHVLPGQRERLLDQAGDAEVPGVEVDLWHRAVVQHRPLLGQVLAGRQPIGNGALALVERATQEVECQVGRSVHREIAGDGGHGMIEPVKRSRIYEHIVQQIRALISDGSWAPGDQIPPERELAERFRVSRTSVREALRALEMQGVIESRQGGGTFVRSAEPELLIPPLAAAILRGQRELGEVLEVCELLEPGVARYAALRASPEAVEELDAVLARQRASVEGDDRSSSRTRPSTRRWRGRRRTASCSTCTR